MPFKWSCNHYLKLFKAWLCIFLFSIFVGRFFLIGVTQTHVSVGLYYILEKNICSYGHSHIHTHTHTHTHTHIHSLFTPIQFYLLLLVDSRREGSFTPFHNLPPLLSPRGLIIATPLSPPTPLTFFNLFSFFMFHQFSK